MNNLARKCARISVRGHYLFQEQTVFPEQSSKKTVRFEDKLLRVFSQHAYSDIFYCYIAGVFPATARPFIGKFMVT